VALEKLKTHTNSLDLDKLGESLRQKIIQAQKEINPKDSYSNVAFFKMLCRLYNELNDMMLNDKAENNPIYNSSDAKEVLGKI